jgi:hypothetical protein
MKSNVIARNWWIYEKGANMQSGRNDLITSDIHFSENNKKIKIYALF